MKLEVFEAIMEKLDIPGGNYMFRSAKTKIIYWFMVCRESPADKPVLLEVFKPGSKRYEELLQARKLHRILDSQGKNWHGQIMTYYKSLKKGK